MGGVYAVVLTYNRSELLEQCLNAIAKQTVPIDTVLVIDNGSTDGTTEMLREEYPWVEVCQAAENSGAAGGFNLAMRVAVAAGADFAWVMDDDVIPEVDALERLQESFEFVEEASDAPPFVVSTARAPNGEFTNVPDIDQSRNSLKYPNWPLYLEKGLIPVRRATFVSILLPRSTFLSYGYPLSSMFIWGEDSEFTMRVTKKAPGFMCGASRVVHLRALAGRLDIRSETKASRLKWHRYFVRNGLYTRKRHASKAVAMKYAGTKLREALHLFVEGRFVKSSLIVQGVFQGLFFNPNESRFIEAIDDSGISFMTDSLHSRLTAKTFEKALSQKQHDQDRSDTVVRLRAGND